MKKITLEDCENLLSRFLAYTDTAEQHEFPILAMVNMKLETTMEKLREAGGVENQSEARAMFRVILKVIGGDYSEYMEE